MTNLIYFPQSIRWGQRSGKPARSKQMRCAKPDAFESEPGRCVFALESPHRVASVEKIDAILSRTEGRPVSGTAVADFIQRRGGSLQWGETVITSVDFAGFNLRVGGEAAALLMKSCVTAFRCGLNPQSGKPNCWFWIDRHGHLHPGQLSRNLRM